MESFCGNPKSSQPAAVGLKVTEQLSESSEQTIVSQPLEQIITPKTIQQGDSADNSATKEVQVTSRLVL